MKKNCIKLYLVNMKSTAIAESYVLLKTAHQLLLRLLINTKLEELVLIHLNSSLEIIISSVYSSVSSIVQNTSRTTLLILCSLIFHLHNPVFHQKHLKTYQDWLGKYFETGTDLTS